MWLRLQPRKIHDGERLVAGLPAVGLAKAGGRGISASWLGAPRISRIARMSETDGFAARLHRHLALPAPFGGQPGGGQIGSTTKGHQGTRIGERPAMRCLPAVGSAKEGSLGAEARCLGHDGRRLRAMKVASLCPSPLADRPAPGHDASRLAACASCTFWRPTW